MQLRAFLARTSAFAPELTVEQAYPGPMTIFLNRAMPNKQSATVKLILVSLRKVGESEELP